MRFKDMMEGWDNGMMVSRNISRIMYSEVSRLYEVIISRHFNVPTFQYSDAILTYTK